MLLAPTASSALKMRRALGRLRRSAAVENTANFFALHRRRAQQRLHGRFVRGTWLHTADYLSAHPDRGRYHSGAEPGGRTYVPPPTFLSSTPVDAPGNHIRFTRRPAGIAELVRPWVVGHSGAVIGSDRHLLWDLSYEWPGRPQSHTTYQLTHLDAAPLPGITLTLAAMSAEKNYFHLLLNSLARLAYLSALPAHLSPDRYLISGPVTPFISEALALFRIDRARIIGTTDFPASRPELLLAPPLVNHPFVVPAQVCEFLHRSIVGARPVPTQRRRIFIDRSDACYRRIVNFDDLLPTLNSLGLEPIQLAGRSLAEQAALFHDASLVVANHGAALSNLVFCSPGTRVIQILAPGMMEREYRTISHHGHLQHDYLVAQFAHSSDAHLPRKDRDLILSPDSLLRAVESNRAVPF